ncbi:MAG: thiol-disulfide oxidoreductase DCC family protein [Ignavibacteriaceae bacterium]|nr:thiol-disulfide oxidoreductase DCC family protein [Ignavibacteriaceae bacterium]
MIDEKQIILFDGVCNFCNFWVNFVITRDKKDSFRFAAMQSEKAKELANKFDIDISSMDTFILINDDDKYVKSTAALNICKQLTGPIKMFYPFILVPKIFRDFVYDMIAKNRYKLFGRRQSCRVPTEADRSKFFE